MKSEFNEGALTFFLEGRIDSNNASEMEKEIMDASPIFNNVEVAIDAEKLEYISSAGLRVLLKLKKRLKKDLTIRNASDEIYDIFDVTGFSDIFNIERQMRRISIRGCKKISSALR